jgi:hypothetical protein
MESRKNRGRFALALALLLAGAMALGAQEGPPPPPEGLTFSGGLNTGVRFTTYAVDGFAPKADPYFDHYITDLGPVNFLMLNGRYDGGNYGAQFGLGFTPVDPGFAAPPSDMIAINNAFGWVYALDKKLHIRAGKVEEFNWTSVNVWSPNYRRLSWAAGYTVIDGLTVNVYGDIPNPGITDQFTPEAYAKNLDLGVYYTSTPFDFFVVVDDTGNYRPSGGNNGSPGDPTAIPPVPATPAADPDPDHLDAFFQFSLKSVTNLTLSLESKVQNIYSSDSDLRPISNITGILAGYKFTDKLAAQTFVQLGNGDFTTFFDGGAKAIDEDMDFTFALKPQVSYAITDSLKVYLDAAFSVPRTQSFEDFNMYFLPWIQWAIAPGLFGPAAQIQFRYRLDVYNDDRPADPATGFAGGAKVRNDGSLAHSVAVELSISF